MTQQSGSIASGTRITLTPDRQKTRTEDVPTGRRMKEENFSIFKKNTNGGEEKETQHREPKSDWEWRGHGPEGARDVSLQAVRLKKKTGGGARKFVTTSSGSEGRSSARLRKRVATKKCNNAGAVGRVTQVSDCGAATQGPHSRYVVGKLRRLHGLGDETQVANASRVAP